MNIKKLLLPVALSIAALFTGTNRAGATTCANATAITASLPIVNQSISCGTTNDITSTNTVVTCGSSNYYGGLEALYTYTPTTAQTVTISFNGGTTTNYAGIFVFGGCPTTAGTTCVGASNSSSGYTTNLTVTLTANTTYYVMFDTWPSPASPCPGTFSITSCQAPTALASGSITPTTASLSFTGTASNYQIEYGTSSTLGSATNTRVSTTASPYALSGLTQTTTYYSWVRSICAAGDTSAWSSSASFTTTTACAAPTAITRTNITAAGVTIGWTAPATAPASGYSYEVRSSGAAGSGATGLAASGTTAAGTTTAIVTGLAAATNYSVYVRSNCGTPGFSIWTSASTFTTLCLPSTLPFAENFATVPPSCWSQATGFLSATASSPTITTSTSWGLDQYLNNSANGPAARINLYTTGKRDWLISPSIDLGASAGNFALGFNIGIVAYSGSTTITTSVGATLGSDDTLAVLVSTNNGASWSTANAVQTFTTANTPVNASGNRRYIVPLSGLSGQIKVAFYASEGATSGTDNDIFVDSVTLVTCTLPVVNLGSDTALCTGSSVTLNAGNAGATYLWSTGATTQTVTTSTAGTYSVRVTNPTGCIGRDTIVVSVNPVPVVNLGNDTSICSGNAITLNAGNAGATYLWSTGATTQTVVASVAGTYSVRVTNSSGCTGRDTVVVTAGSTPTINLGNDTAVCSGTTVTLNAGNAGATYLWSTGATTQTVAATAAGTYSVRVTSPTGCTGRDTVVVTVNPLPVVALGNDGVVCIGSSRTLNAGNPGASYLWSTGATTQIISVGTAGTYSVRVTNALGCIGRDTINIGAKQRVVAGTIIVTGQSPAYIFTITGNQNDSLRAWNFGDGIIDTTSLLTSTGHFYTADGTYTVTFYSINSCSIDSVKTTVRVGSIGINNVDLDGDLTLFPNPASEFVTIKNTSNQDMKHVTVLNVLGAVVSETDVTNGREQRVNIHGLAAGSYLIRVQLNGTTVVRRLQITK